MAQIALKINKREKKLDFYSPKKKRWRNNAVGCHMSMTATTRQSHRGCEVALFWVVLKNNASRRVRTRDLDMFKCIIPHKHIYIMSLSSAFCQNCGLYEKDPELNTFSTPSFLT